MGEHAEIWNAIRADRRERRHRNRELSPQILDAHGVSYVSKNDGAHLIVSHGELVIDFWPGTGKWVVRRKGMRGRGVRPLLDTLALDCGQRIAHIGRRGASLYRRRQVGYELHVHCDGAWRSFCEIFEGELLVDVGHAHGEGEQDRG